MKKKEASILDQYNIKVSKIVLLCCIVADIVGFMLLNILKFFNYMKNLSLTTVMFVDICIVIPEVIIFSWQYLNVVKNGELDKKIFRYVKTTIMIVLIANYYVITAVFPSGELWHVLFSFAVIEALFLDLKLTIILNCVLTASIPVICCIQPQERPSSEAFMENVAIRTFLTFLVMLLIIIMVYCSGRILLNIKEDKQRSVIAYLEKIEENQNEIREIKHNLKNEILVLKSIIDEKDIDGADNFLNTMIKDTEKLNSYMYSENFVLNSVINAKVNMAQEYNIKWNIEVRVPRYINIESGDMGIIIGNLLDNAIEACSLINEGDRYINVEIFTDKRNMVINIENTKNNIIFHGRTWKEDKKNHGIGLNSVSKIALKYNGALNVIDKGNSYEANVILWNK